MKASPAEPGDSHWARHRLVQPPDQACQDRSDRLLDFARIGVAPLEMRIASGREYAGFPCPFINAPRIESRSGSWLDTRRLQERRISAEKRGTVGSWRIEKVEAGSVVTVIHQKETSTRRFSALSVAAYVLPEEGRQGRSPSVRFSLCGDSRCWPRRSRPVVAHS